MSTQNEKRTRKRWAASAGDYGRTIRVFEEANGIIYAEVRDPSRPGRYITRSLRHKDKAAALRWVKAEAAKLQAGVAEITEIVPTVAKVLGSYLKHASPRKTKAEQDADERRAQAWTRWLGPAKDLSKLTLREWETFIDARSSGAIDSRGDAVPPGKWVPTRAATVGADCVFLRTVLNWAAKWRECDRYLMRENPARGYPIPVEKNPRRPVVSPDRFLAVRAVADRITTVRGRGKTKAIVPSYLPEVLDLLWHTGRRVSAVLALRFSDLHLSPTKESPHGSILWPATSDKMKKQWLAPLNPEARAALDRIIAERPGIGAAYLFPAINTPSKPIAVEVVSAWLLKAEELAGVEKHEGSLFHAYRRAWATARKGLPDVDVAAAGGWSDVSSLKTCYQQADAETMYRVVSEPSRVGRA